MFNRKKIATLLLTVIMLFSSQVIVFAEVDKNLDLKDETIKLTEYEYAMLLQKTAKQYGVEFKLNDAVSKTDTRIAKVLSKSEYNDLMNDVTKKVKLIAENNKKVRTNYENTTGKKWENIIWTPCNESSIVNLKENRYNIYSYNKYHSLGGLFAHDCYKAIGRVTDRFGYFSFIGIDSSSAWGYSFDMNYVSFAFSVNYVNNKRAANIYYDCKVYYEDSPGTFVISKEDSFYANE